MTKYSEAVFEKAEAELARRRSAAEAAQRDRQFDIEQRYPEIKKLNSELERTSIRYMGIVLAGGADVNEKIQALRSENLKAQEQLAELLQAFTGDRAYLDTRYTCPDCRDTGYVEGLRCRCFKELLKRYSSEELSSTSGIVLNDFSQFKLDYYDAAPGGNSPRDKMLQQYRYCRSYAAEFSENLPSLLFMGRTGLGKTFMSSCIAKEVIEQGSSVVFSSLISILRKLEDEHFGREEGDTMGRLMDCDLLILDDLGSEYRTPFTESALYEILNSRINLRRPMIISTNLLMPELNERYNDRIISRLMGCFSPIMFVGRDIRSVKKTLGVD